MTMRQKTICPYTRICPGLALCPIKTKKARSGYECRRAPSICTKCGKRKPRPGKTTCQRCEDRALDALIAFAHLSDPRRVGLEKSREMREKFDRIIGCKDVPPSEDPAEGFHDGRR